jgi:hypothetical protein
LVHGKHKLCRAFFLGARQTQTLPCVFCIGAR